MTKKLALLLAAAMMIQVAPVLAGPNGDGPGHKGKMFESKDTNGDGVISKDEFLNGAGDRFDKMDANGDGHISKEEAQDARQKMHEKRQEMREKRQERRGGNGPSGAEE